VNNLQIVNILSRWIWIVDIRKYSRILLTKQRIFAINIRTNANISFKVSVNIHIREYIFVVFSSLWAYILTHGVHLGSRYMLPNLQLNYQLRSNLIAEWLQLISNSSAVAIMFFFQCLLLPFSRLWPLIGCRTNWTAQHDHNPPLSITPPLSVLICLHCYSAFNLMMSISIHSVCSWQDNC
jgi:hypothetical protein